MSAFYYQQLLFEKIKGQLKRSQSLIDYMTDLLQISRDSGYRRLRGETHLSFDEAMTLARHFRIPLGEIAGYSDHSASFSRQPFIRDLSDYRHYMKKSVETLEDIRTKRHHNMIYSAKDVPIFYQFAFPRLAAFKIYVWLKSIYDIQTIEEQYYNLDQVPSDLLDLARAQWNAFSQINTVEIWNDTTILSMLNQIGYYYEAGLLSNRDEAMEICDQFQEMLKLIYRQSVTGQKVHASNTKENSGATCKLYYHEILIMDNHILTEYDEGQMYYFVPYAGLNYMVTSDPQITGQMQSYLHLQISKSALMSDVSEKERNRFFIRMKGKIDHLREKIKNTDPFM